MPQDRTGGCFPRLVLGNFVKPPLSDDFVRDRRLYLLKLIPPEDTLPRECMKQKKLRKHEAEWLAASKSHSTEMISPKRTSALGNLFHNSVRNVAAALTLLLQNSCITNHAEITVVPSTGRICADHVETSSAFATMPWVLAEGNLRHVISTASDERSIVTICSGWRDSITTSIKSPFPHPRSISCESFAGSISIAG